MPKAGWYGNYVYAMLPKCKPHLAQKCEKMRPATTPFRKQGKKAYITGYIHGFCNKKAVFSLSCEYNPLEFVPFVEILKVDWAAAEPRQSSQARDVFSSPLKPSTPATVKGRVVFDPFAQMSADDKSDRGPRTPTKSGLPGITTFRLQYSLSLTRVLPDSAPALPQRLYDRYRRRPSRNNCRGGGAFSGFGHCGRG